MSPNAVFKFKISAELLEAFADLTADRSSVHMDSEFARLTRFRQPIMHGMLPILFLGAWAARNRPGQAPKALKMNFKSPVFIEETLELRIHGENFLVVKCETEATVTEGSVEWSPANLSMPTDLIPSDKLIENCFQLSELRAGMTSTLSPIPSLSFRESIGIAFETQLQDRSSLSDYDFFNIHPAFLLSLSMSPFVGMKIPGRFAALSDVSISFASFGWDNPELKGTVTQVLMGSSRIKLGFEWTDSGQVIATGTAGSLVGLPAPVGISSEEVHQSHRDLGLSGKVALVIGASRGIGEATAKLMASQGTRVAVHYFRGEASAQNIVREITEQGGYAELFRADIRIPEDVQSLRNAVLSKFGHVDILVNAAVDEFSPKEFLKLAWEDFQKELEVTVRGVLNVCQSFVPAMKEKKSGKIILFGTIAVDLPVSGQSKYITIKSALTGLTRSLAHELATDRIQVNLVVPGMTRTSLLSSLSGELISRTEAESATQRILEPIEVAKLIAFLASDWSNAISGQKIVLNQGEAPYV